MDRPNGGFRRGFSQGNGIEVQQAPTDRSQPDRQGEDWSMPTNIERRENEIGRWRLHQPLLLMFPLPQRIGYLLIGVTMTPLEKSKLNITYQLGVLNTPQTVNQTEQPELDPVRNEAVGSIFDDVTTVPSTR